MKGNRLPWVLAVAPLVFVAALPTAAQNPSPSAPPAAPVQAPAAASGTGVAAPPVAQPVLVAINTYNNTAYLRPFPAATVPGAYGFSQNSDYHYAVPYAAEAVRYAAYSVHRQFGTCLAPMQVHDCSKADGDTPDGRHPGSAHDGGVNFDLTYYMKRPVASFIVCPLNANGHCTGPAEDLDADRQAYFFAVLARLDLEFNRALVQKMAVDGWVLQAILPALDSLEQERLFTTEEIANAKRLVYGEMVDKGTGWFRYHHNHTHVRFHWQPAQAGRMMAVLQTKNRTLTEEPADMPDSLSGATVRRTKLVPWEDLEVGRRQ